MRSVYKYSIGAGSYILTTYFYSDFCEMGESAAAAIGRFVVASAPLAAPLGGGSRAAIPDDGVSLGRRHPRNRQTFNQFRQ